MSFGRPEMLPNPDPDYTDLFGEYAAQIFLAGSAAITGDADFLNEDNSNMLTNHQAGNTVEIRGDGPGGVSDRAIADNFNKQIDAAYDVDVSDTSVIKDRIEQGMDPERARAEYANYLIDQINAIQGNLEAVMDDAQENREIALLNALMNDWSRLDALESRISRGSTEMGALENYYDRLEAIKGRAPIVTASL